MDSRLAVPLTAKGAQFMSNSADDGSTVKVTADEARALTALGMIDTAAAKLISVGNGNLIEGGTGVARGFGFGATKGAGTITVDGVVQTTTFWSDNEIRFNVTQPLSEGSYQVVVTPDGESPTNALVCQYDEPSVAAGAFTFTGTAATLTLQ